MSDFGVADADLQREINRSALQDLWQALINVNFEEAAKKYANDAVMDFPQDGLYIAGRREIARRGLIQAGETVVTLNRIVGDGQVWVSECETHMYGHRMLLVSVAEMHGELILREIRYRAPITGARRDARL